MQNIDNILFEKNSTPRLQIMVTKNEPEKIAKVKITHFFCRYRKILTKKMISCALSLMCPKCRLSQVHKYVKHYYFKIFSLSLPFL